jgi:hypothetical protein
MAISRTRREWLAGILTGTPNRLPLRRERLSRENTHPTHRRHFSCDSDQIS